ncbi:kinetochore protein SPC25 homolog isoform X2 [Actinidia eriantha]|uniref:kinetochore protein SPC25 homolog isoform X2 n=1 Tax=Actinidia eriantha TaxID=165200 RepID=UPI0025890B92|nr:kinetochore protein SPC25 homolog isoform X2 [Actinidia eriantha]
MQSRTECSVRTKMEELRLVCEREIPIQQQRADAAIASFRKSLESTRAKAQETVQNQAKLGKLKAELREAEDDLVKALAVKTRKEATRTATMDSLSAAKARIEELQRIVEDQKARKNEYADIIRQQYEACEEKCNKNTGHRGEIEEAISWYNMVLGFRIECGHGVKFIFTNINVKNPKEEYSFSVRHENDLYTLLDCDPHLDDTKELIHELNRNNGLFKFVRIMREKFQEAVAHGISSQVTYLDQDSSTISVYAPVSSVSTDSFVSNQKEIQPEETNRQSKKANYGRGGKLMAGIFSPGSASPLRRSSRSKVKK